MNTLIALAALVLSQVATQSAYLLDHPIDPNLLIIATLDGRYPFAPLAGTDCTWLHSDMNVSLTSQRDQLWQVTDGNGTCNLAVQARVDATPCFVNDAGECDIEGEHQWT